MMNKATWTIFVLCIAVAACFEGHNETKRNTNPTQPGWVGYLVLDSYAFDAPHPNIVGGEAVWYVPPKPTGSHGQTVYYFLSHWANSHSIQAVISYNPSTGWLAQACYGLQTAEPLTCSDGVSVKEGDKIKGVIQYTAIPSNGHSLAIVLASVYANDVLATSYYVNQANWWYTTVRNTQILFGIQVLNAASCGDFPPSNSLTIAKIVPYFANPPNPTPTFSSFSWNSAILFGSSCSFSAFGIGSNLQFRWQSDTSTPAYYPGYIGSDFTGGDIAHGYASSGLECAQQCDLYGDCYAWTFEYPGGGCANNHNCYLKTALGSASGPVFNSYGCLESNYKVGDANTDRLGGDLRTIDMSQTATWATAAACSYQCDIDPACRAWAWYLHICYLKNQIVPAVPGTGITSGVKGIKKGIPFYLNTNTNLLSAPMTLDSNVFAVPQGAAGYPRPFLYALQGAVANHQWIFLDAPDGNFLIKSNFLSNMCLNGDASAPNPVVSPVSYPFMATCDANNLSQRWQFIPVSTSSRFTFKITNIGNGMCLDANTNPSPQYNPATPAPFLWNCNESPVTSNHIWTITVTPYLQ